MTEEKSLEEVKDMHPDAQHDYLIQKDVFNEEEWELYKDVVGDSYHLREITRRSFEPTNGTKYLISVEHWSDGERPDEMNTRINIVEQGNSDSKQ